MYQNVRNIPEIEEVHLSLEVRGSRLHHLKHVSRTLWEESRASGDRQSESSGYFLLRHLVLLHLGATTLRES
jgi:hypothetical protein